MKTNDDIILEQLYSEGFLDRTKAKFAGSKARKEAGVSFGDVARSKTIDPIASKLGKKLGYDVKVGNDRTKRLNKGESAKVSAQANQLVAGYTPKFKKLANGLAADLKKMNLDVSLIDDDATRKLLIAILKYSG